MKRKQNELYMAFINEVCKTETTVVVESKSPSPQKPKARIVRFRKVKRVNSLSTQESILSTTERQSFEEGIAELENNLVFENEVRNLELKRHVREALRKERESIGFELHDNINQILATAKLYVEMLIPSSEEDRNIQGKASELIRRAFDEIRCLSRQLANHPCPKHSFSNELQGLIDEIKSTGKYIVHFEHDFNEEYVSTTARKNLFRIAQEQLKNILEYSKAKCISITLKQLSDQLFFIIKDDGIGFDQKTYQQGLGHANILRRVTELNGKLEWNSEKDQGCTLMISIPVTEK